MPLFTYRAMNEDNKEVRGSLEAADEYAARSALEQMHLDVLEVTEASRNRPAVTASASAEVPSFAFEGKDPNGMVHRGTVQATTKQEAFKRLQSEQKLYVNMLSPVGTLPQFRDPELEQWQRQTTPPSASVPTAPTPVTAPPAFKRPSVGFTNVPVAAKQPVAPKAIEKPAKEPRYHSIAATLRLYAGWLLAWYGLFVAAGYYAYNRALPWDIPFVQAFYVSPLIFSFIVAMFLFLLLSAISRTMKAGPIANIALSLVGLGLFVAVRYLGA